jgi:cell division septum initiation protein DivIVA
VDIQHLVDRLEDLIDEGFHWPMTKFTMIDEEHALEIIDQMRISVPEQIEKASRLINQRDRLLAQANEEASRIVQLAQERNTEMTSRDAIVQTAQSRAKGIIEQAHQDAERIRSGADEYALDVLHELEEQLLRNLNTVRNGIAKIMEKREASQAQIQAVYDQAAAELSATLPELAEVSVSSEVVPPAAAE